MKKLTAMVRNTIDKADAVGPQLLDMGTLYERVYDLDEGQKGQPLLDLSTVMGVNGNNPV